MKTRDEQLKTRTMRRIYGIWFVRQVLPLFCLEVLVFSAIIVGAQSYMSFSNIMNNILVRMDNFSPMNFGNFIMNAFTNTEVVSLILFTGAFVVGSFIMKDTFKLSRKGWSLSSLSQSRFSNF
ncbi:MAG: hypothetical protein O2794_04460 [bacterium]|nr:hypothetical protein [bacterium]